MCLAIAEGATWPMLVLGLGTVHPNCYVNHFGSINNNASTAWVEESWKEYYQNSPQYVDTAFNLILRFPQLEAGASVTFTWFYLLRANDITAVSSAGPNVMALMQIHQPVTVATGPRCVYAVKVNAVSSNVMFYIRYGTSQLLLGVSSSPTIPAVNGGGLYMITFNSTLLASGLGYVVRATVYF